jgi:urease accessory protein
VNGTTPPRDAVDAEVVLVADRRGTRTRLTTMRSAFPVALRRTGPERVHLVGTGAWPLGGDRVRLVIEVGPDAELDVAAVAANVALPGRSGRPSVVEVQVRIASGGRLHLDLGPTIVAQGADHRAILDVDLGVGSRVALRELVVLGREGERGGRSDQRLDVTREGLAVVREHAIRPDPRAPAFTDDGARAVGSVLVVDGRPGTASSLESAAPCRLDAAARSPGGRAAVAGAMLALPEGSGWRAVALGDDVAAIDGWLAARWVTANSGSSRRVPVATSG